MRAGDRAQWIKELDAKPEAEFNPRVPHGGRRTDSQVVLCPPHRHLNTPASHTHTVNV